MYTKKAFIKNMFTDKNFWRATLILALPIALQNLLSSSLAIIDNIMIGQLGDIAVGAVGEAAQVAFLVNISLFGVTAGGSIFSAQFWGQKDIPGIQRTYGIVMICCVALSTTAAILVSTFPEVVLSFYTNSDAIISLGSEYLQIAAFSYIGIGLNLGFCAILRSVECVKLPVISNLISVSVNIFFNSVLIFGLLGFPKMGVRGAAIATVIASFVNPAVIFIVSFFKKYMIRCKIKAMFAFPKGFIPHFFKISLPVFCNEAMWALGVAGTNMVFGRMGETNIAALTITRTVENIAFVLIVGMCNACGVMIGKSIGEDRIPRAKIYARRFTLLVPMTCIILGWIVILLRTPILSLFALSDQATATAAVLLLIYGLEMPLRNMPYITIVGIFRPGGDTRTGFVYDMSCLWCIALPVTVILGLIIKIDFIAVYPIMLLCEDIPKTILCIRHMLSNRWVRKITY